MGEDLNFERETNLEKKLRKNKLLIPFVTYSLALLFLAGIYGCILLFNLGHYWAVVPSGLLTHSFLILCLHDASHKSITRSNFDRIFLNFCAGLVILPFYGEHYRKYHLTHHANTNKELDPICPPITRKLYENTRWLYVLCEFIPLVYTFYSVVNYHKNRDKAEEQRKPKTIKINHYYVILAVCVSIAMLILVKPPIWFLVLNLVVLNIVSVFRNWCEHIGTAENKESNTYWFPLGMGIGNHETHHHHANFSWLTLSIILLYRKKDTNPFKSFLGILFNKSFRYYRDF